MKSEHTGRKTASELDKSVSRYAEPPAATDRRVSALHKGAWVAVETGGGSDWRHTQESEDDRWDVQLESTGGVCLLIT